MMGTPALLSGAGKRVAVFLLIGILLGGLGGCANLGVKPWERDLLAEPGMEIDPDVVVTALDEHIYFSKEASTGGLGTAGGGCGCN
jgi:hypothetical protein